MIANFYEQLGVGVDADTEAIKDAYWALATPHHLVLAALASWPRRARDADRIAEAQRELAQLGEAYAVLCDPHHRLRHDAALAGVDLETFQFVVEDAARDAGFDVEVDARPTRLPTVPACVVCGGRPAVPVLLQEVTGMLAHHRLDKVREALCTDCGIATYRRLQARTLLRGWWGFLAVIRNWTVVFTNRAMARRLTALPDPQRPGAWPDGTPPAPLDPGAPLWRRPKLLAGGVVILGLVVATVIDTFVL